LRKNKNLGAGYAIGYIIAGIVLLPLLIYGVNKLFFQGNDAEKYIRKYLNQSLEIKLYVDLSLKNDFTLEDLKAGKSSFTFGHERYTAFLSKRGGKIYIDKIGFFSQKFNKYFTIRLTNVGDDFSFIFRRAIDKKDVIATVNKEDLESPNLGTKENPIPIFKIKGADGFLTIDDENYKDKSYDITQAQYENSVYCHLKYVMSKEEFASRFEKK
jgi:hypothetical protein